MSWRRPSFYTGAWIAAVVIAVAVGVLTVTVLAASMKDRGPIGEAVLADVPASVVSTPASSLTPSVLPAPAGEAAGHRQTFSGEYGDFEVSCVGAQASTVGVRAASGWREVSHESGPDDDVDAVFTDGAREVEVTVFCNRGTPTIDEIEYDTLGRD